jgi:hypothetical protein
MEKMSRKSKIVVGSLLGVAVLALTGVGVASWVISGTTGKTTDQIGVTVGSTEDKRINITAASVTDAALSFDAQNDDTTGPITAGTGSSEDLAFAFTFDVTGVSNMASFNLKYSPDTDATNNGLTQLQAAVTANYLVSPLEDTTAGTTFTLPATLAVGIGNVTATAPTGATLVSSITAYDGTAGTATISVTATFGWGTAFASKNPCLIASDATDASVSAYKTGLTSVYALNSKKLYVVITPTAK